VETNSKFKFPKVQNTIIQRLGIWILVIRYCLEFRYWNLGFIFDAHQIIFSVNNNIPVFAPPTSCLSDIAAEHKNTNHFLNDAQIMPM